MIRFGANATLCDNDGNTALHYAAHCDAFYPAKLLLSKNADVFQRNKQGLSPFHHAIRAGNRELCGLLLDRGGVIQSKQKNADKSLKASSRSIANPQAEPDAKIFTHEIQSSTVAPETEERCLSAENPAPLSVHQRIEHVDVAKQSNCFSTTINCGPSENVAELSIDSAPQAQDLATMSLDEMRLSLGLYALNCKRFDIGRDLLREGEFNQHAAVLKEMARKVQKLLDAALDYAAAGDLEELQALAIREGAEL